MIDYLPCLPIGLLFATGLVLLALHTALPGTISAWVAAAAVALSLAASGAMYVPLQAGPVAVFLFQWAPLESAGVSFGIRVDHLSSLLAVLCLTTGFLVVAFTAVTRGSGCLGPASPHPATVPNGDESCSAADITTGCDGTASTPCPICLRSYAPQLYGWAVCLLGAMLAVLYAGNVLMLYLAWSALGICIFGVRLARTTTPDETRRAGTFLISDQLASIGLLAGALLLNRETGALLLLPSSKATESSELALALVMVPALVHMLQYPFSRLLTVIEQPDTAVGALIEPLVCGVSGSYLLLRVASAGGSGSSPVGVVALALGTATAVYGLITAYGECDIGRIASRASIVDLGLVTASFAVGTYAAVATGLMLLVSHVLSRAALGVAVQSLRVSAEPVEWQSNLLAADRVPTFSGWPLRNIALGVGVASLCGLPPFAGFWGRWMLAGVGLAQGNLLLLALPIVSVAVLAWRFLPALDTLLMTRSSRPTVVMRDVRQMWTELSVAVCSGIAVLAAVLASPLLTWLVEPAVRAATGGNGSLASLALTAGTDALDGWGAALTLCLFLAAAWLVFRALPMPLTLKHRLKISLSPLTLGTMLGFDPLRVISTSWCRTAGWTTWLLEPDRVWLPLLSLTVGLGRVLDRVAMDVEERYFVPAVLIAAVVLVLMFVG